MGEFFTAEQYVDDVLSGKQVACKWVRLACERHRRDLETGADRGLVFDTQAARMAIAFISLLKHSKGEWAGQNIHLEPWQQFIIWVIFGWRRDQSAQWIEETPNGLEDSRGMRRFRTVYQEIARKNGKSTLAAGVGLYLFTADGEPGAEVYTAATKRDQARITHKEAIRMVKSSPKLQREFGIKIMTASDNMNIPGTASKFEALGADSDTMDGLNIHGAIIDELHAHKNRGTYDVIDTATGARRQPMIFGITTAGTDRQSLCFDLHEYTEKVLSGVIEDDSFFGVIFSLDYVENENGEQVLEDWEDERNWPKANPNLGVSKKWDDMRRKARKATNMPAALSAFLRLELNIWTQASAKWIPVEKWLECGQAVDPDGLRGRICYGGLDLSSNSDITAWVLVFPPEAEGDPYQVLCRFFIPQDNVYERVKNDRVPYDAWIRQGYISTTPGNVVDYDFIFAQIEKDMGTFDVAQLAFDRWGSRDVISRIQKLNDDPKFLVEFGQGYASMSPAMKDAEDLILTKRLAHGGNPVLTWMADNVVAKQDPAGNKKPDKQASREKIDGIVAWLMGLSRAIVNEGSTKSVYDERGILEL